MQLSYKRFQQVFPHFNQIPLTEQDFWRTAQSEKIVVSETEMVPDGYFERRNGKSFILINKRLRGIFWRRTAFHELVHHFVTPPDLFPRVKQYRTPLINIGKEEQIADALALIAVLPFADAYKYAAEDWSDAPDFGEILEERLKLYLDFGV